MTTLMKASGRIGESDSARNLSLIVLSPAPDANKGGSDYTNYPAFINETRNGKKLPGRYCTLTVINSANGPFMAITAPMRELNEDGSFVYRPRIDQAGQMVNEKGEVVQDKEKAQQQFEYLTYTDPTDGTEKVVYGTIATLNIKNKRVDGTPLARSMLLMKYFEDEQALEAERVTFGLKQFEKGSPEYEEIREELSRIRDESGNWVNVFIDRGYEFLQKHGFDVKLPDNSPGPSR